jgi:hypothetical protein
MWKMFVGIKDHGFVELKKPLQIKKTLCMHLNNISKPKFELGTMGITVYKAQYLYHWICQNIMDIFISSMFY